jgi:hypothetical protein
MKKETHRRSLEGRRNGAGSDGGLWAIAKNRELRVEKETKENTT